MNKNRFRVIYSQVRGVFIAVAETVKSRTKVSGQSTLSGEAEVAEAAASTTYKRLNPLNFAVVSMLGAVLVTLPLNSIANTQIIADKSAPNNQQPTILNSGNGLVQVNIQTPSAGGVSRNTYKQFDVGQEGAILNNARNNTQTQIGGWVQGNPWLAKGEAKVILNEVNSSNPSQLKGYLEVAGKQAQVVIANPSGLVCDGCGVINATRFTLTTGQAVMNQGYLESFRVRDGQVTIAGKGLDGSLTPFTDIYSRALTVNAGLYANSLSIVLGQNDIDVRDQAAAKINAATANLNTSNNKPNFALDVGQLGGMYAGKIFLVGTENGLGVRNAGSINATSGQLTLTANGDLVNAGNIIANKDQVQLTAHNVTNSGNISSSTSRVTLQSKNLDNSGLISSADELHLQNQNALNNSGKINAARIVLDTSSLKNNGSIEQTGLQALDLKSGQMSNVGGKIGVAKKVEDGGTGETGSGSNGEGTGPIVPKDPAKDGGSLEVAVPKDTTPKTYDAGYIHVKNNFNNDQGAVVANGAIDLVSQQGLNNQGGELNLGTVVVKGDAFNNNSGKLNVKQADIHTQSFSNQAGQLASNQKLSIKAKTADNQKGKIQAVEQLDIQIAEALNNTEGQIASKATVQLNAGHLNNHSGVVYSEEQALNVQVQGKLDNTSGLIQAQTDLDLNSQSLNNRSGQILANQITQQHVSVDNTQGAIVAKQNLSSTVQQFDNNQGQVQGKSVQLKHEQLTNSGSIYADQDLSITGQKIQTSGTLAAGNNVVLSSQTLEQTNTGLIAAGLDREGKLGKAGDLSILAAETLALHGKNFAGNNLVVQAQGDIDASQGQLQAKNIDVLSKTGNVSTQAGSVIAQAQLQISSQDLINNQQGQLSAQNVVLKGQQLNNSQAKIQHVGNQNLNLNFEKGLNNKSGEISSNADALILNANTFNNESGKLIHAGKQDLKIAVGQLQGTQGQILSNGALTLTADQVVLDQAESVAEQIDITANSLSHNQGKMQQRGEAQALQLKISNALNNQQGVIASQKGLAINASSLNNQAGQLLSGQGDLDLNIKNKLDNSQAGQLVSGADAKLKVGTFDNSQKGLISSTSALNILSQDGINNKQGQIVANQDISIVSQGLDNTSGQIGTRQGQLNLDTGTGAFINASGAIQSEKELMIKAEQIDNQAGLINGQAAVHLQSLKEINNAAGQIIANQDLDIHSQGFNNDAGQLGSVKGAVNIQAGQGNLSNQSGKIQSAQDLKLNAQQVDNQSGLISAQKQLQLTTNKLNNQKGQLLSGDAIDITAENLDNQAGAIQTSSNLSLNIDGQVDNSHAGILSSGATATIKAGSINNSDKGQINAQNALSITTQKELNNQAGVIVANQDVQIKTQGINNAQGQMGSVKGQFDVDAGQSALDNSSGTLQAGSELNLKATGLNNNLGQIIANKNLNIDSQRQFVNNQLGKLSADNIQMTSGALNNDQGLIQANSSIEIDTNKQDLINSNSAKQGGILSQGNVTLNNIAKLDNRQGYLASGKSLSLTVNQVLNNQGTLLAAENLKVQGIGQNQLLNNQSGQILSMHDMQLDVEQILNQGKQNTADQNSQIMATQNLVITTQQLNNQNTQSTQSDIQGIDAGNLTLTADVVNNQLGGIRSSQNVDLLVSQQLNNQSGDISAVNTLNFQGQTLKIDNLQGQLLAGKQLNILAQSLAGNGKVLSLGDADITLNDRYVHGAESQLQANHDLSLKVNGNDIVNDGKINAGNTLKLKADNISNSKDAAIESHDTQLTATQLIQNTGLINGDYTTLKANVIINQGTGRIYGTDLAISAITLNNLPDINGTAPVIASRGDLNIGVNTLNNLANSTDYSSQALIFSAGGLYLGDALDDQRKATGQAQLINNESATIESLGDMRLSAQNINNINKNFKTEEIIINEGHNLIAGFGPGWYNIDGSVISLDNAENRSSDYRYSEKTTETQVISSTPAKIIAGGNLDLSNVMVFNDKSQILVGGELKNIGGRIDSPEVLGTKKYIAEGRVVHYEIRKGKDKKKWEDFSFSKESTFDLGVTQKLDQQSLNQQNISTTALSNNQSNVVVGTGHTTQTNVADLTTNSGDLKLDQQGNTDTSLQAKDNSTQVNKNDQSKTQAVDQTTALTAQDRTDVDTKANIGEQFEIRTIDATQTKVPNNALYRVGADQKAGYLIETDPNFTNYNKWLSSDYMLSALGLDPALQQKRLGDGFYEQRLVQDQIANLTGYRFLKGYENDDTQYKALMNNGLTVAKTHGLRPGIALTPAQIAQLTSDIVWLVEQNVTLPDGTVTKALVPQVYVKAKVGDLKGDGSLLSANSVNFQLDGDLLNGATIAGREAVNITANNVNNLMGRILGNKVSITTENDLNNVGGQIKANDAMALKIGGNLNILSTTRTSDSQKGDFTSSNTTLDRVAGLYVGDGVTVDPKKASLVVDVAGKTVLKGAEIKNKSGATVLETQGNINIGAVQVGQLDQRPTTAKSAYKFEKAQDIGSQISGEGAVIIAGQNITGKAVNISSQNGNVELIAQNNILLENGVNQQSVLSKDTTKGSFGSKTSSSFNSSETHSIANKINAGQNIIIKSQQGDITATHLVAQAGNNIQIEAEKGHVNLLSAIDEKSASSTTNKKNAIAYNNRQSGYIDQEVAQTQLTAGKTVDINAGKTIELQANDIKAGESIYVGNTLLQRQADGTLKSADGSLMPENVTLSTLETHDQQWDEQQKGYRGIAKELMKTVAIGLAGVEGLAPGLKANKMTIGESSSHRTEQVKQTGSNLTADQVYVGSAGQTTLTSSNIDANKVVLSGAKVTLNAAEEQNIIVDAKGKETVQGLGVKLNKDNIRLGGFVTEDQSQSSKTTEISHKAGNLNSKDLTIQGANGIDILGQNIKATGDTVLDHGRGDLNIGGYENKTTVEEKTHTETISTEVGVRNAYLDAALALVAVKDAASALKQAKDDYSQAQRDYAAGKITKGALDDTKANLAMATANLASAEIGVGAAAATAGAAASTSFGTGFTIGANGERIETETTTKTVNGQWQGSQLELNNLTLKSEGKDANIQGSRVKATGVTTFDGTHDLNVTAGTEHRQQESDSKTNNQKVSYTYGGGGSASIGKQSSQSKSEGLTHVNSQVELNQVSGSLNKLNIQGGNVSIADRGDLKVKEIHVESLQDTASSSSSSKGGSIGAGFGSSGAVTSGSASYNQAKGKSESAWVNDTSSLLIGNAMNDADLDAMGVQKVTNIGGVIANATQNADGSLTDHGKLNYSGALELQDIQDHRSESNKGFNVSTSIGKPQPGKDANSAKFPSGSTTIGMQNLGNEQDQLTKATMGKGTVKNATDSTHREINNTQEITRDQVTGLLDGSVTVDHRLLRESGRKEIVQEQKDLPENGKLIAGSTATGGLILGSGLVGLLDENGSVKDATTLTKNNAKAAYDAELAAKLQLIQEGKLDNLVDNQDILNQYNQGLIKGTSNQNTQVNLNADLYSAAGSKVDATTNITNKTDIYLDRNAQNNSVGLITHENAHQQGFGEGSSNALGKLGETAFNVNSWVNSKNIDAAKTQIQTAPKIETSGKNDAQAQLDLLKANEQKQLGQIINGDKFEDYQATGSLKLFNDKLKGCKISDRACIGLAVNELRRNDTKWDAALNACVQSKNASCVNDHLKVILASDKSKELQETLDLMKKYGVTGQVFPYLNYKGDVTEGDGLTPTAAQMVKDARAGHNLECVSGVEKNCFKSVTEPSLNQKVANFAVDATANQIMAAFGQKNIRTGEGFSASERDAAVGNLLTMGMLKGPVTSAQLTEKGFVFLEKNYGRAIANKIKSMYTAKSPGKVSDDAAKKIENNVYRDDDFWSNKPSGQREIASGLVGTNFEKWLKAKYGGSGSFNKGGREFDGSIGNTNRWYEAKSGNYWRDQTQSSAKLAKFKSDMGARKKIAESNGATYELHSNTAIPENIKKWLTEKGIPFYEHH